MAVKRNKPELLAPAGDMERLKMAVLYGADAVYLAGTSFGMRAFAGNFSDEELPQACLLYTSGYTVRQTIALLAEKGVNTEEALTEAAQTGDFDYDFIDNESEDLSQMCIRDRCLITKTAIPPAGTRLRCAAAKRATRGGARAIRPSSGGAASAAGSTRSCISCGKTGKWYVSREIKHFFE